MNEFVIDLQKSYELIGDFVKNHNSKFTKKNHREVIKSNQVTFLRKLVYSLAKKLNQAKSRKANLAFKGILKLNHFKSYYINSEYNDLNVCKRTIGNYIKNLEKAGAIKNESTGSKVAIFLHPDLIRFEDKYEVLITCSLCQIFGLDWRKTQKMQIPHIQLLFYPKKQTLPTNNNTRNYNKYLTSVVEKQHNNTTQEQTGSTENTAVDSQGLETVLLETRKAAEKNGGNQAPRPKNLKERAKNRKQANVPLQRENWLKTKVNELFQFARDNFYLNRNQELTASQEQVIYTFYSDCFLVTPNEKLEFVYKRLVRRNKKWLKFLMANEMRFTQWPEQFYNLGNTTGMGFYVTELWVKKDEGKKNTYQVQNSIDTLQRRAQEIVSGKFTFKGRQLTLNERTEAIIEISDQVMRLALKHNRPDLKVQFGNKLQAFIDRHSPSIL